MTHCIKIGQIYRWNKDHMFEFIGQFRITKISNDKVEYRYINNRTGSYYSNTISSVLRNAILLRYMESPLYQILEGIR